MAIEFGRPARQLWSLDETATFLNHGSFGACPVAVLWEQDRIRREMERQPDRFMTSKIEPAAGNTELRQAVTALAEFAGASGERVAFVENASSGVQVVLESMQLAAGDEVLITDHQYNAVWRGVEARCRESGAVPVIARIPLPTTPDEVVAHILEAAGPKVRLAIIDHITSPTALVFPVKEIVAQLHQRGILVLIDGAHALGQVPLDMPAIGADWYVTNAHKWLYAPKGSALLYASQEAAAFTRPLVVSHFIDMGFPYSFDYTGTRDFSGWLASPAALQFMRELGVEKLWNYNAGLVKHGSELMMALGAQPVGPLEMCAAMRTFVLPQTRPATDEDAQSLVRLFWEEERMQIRASVLFSALIFRFSAQAYVDRADLDRMAQVLGRRGWAGRP